MTSRIIIIALVVALGLSWACQDEPPPTPSIDRPFDGQAKTSIAPTLRQRKALANALHRAHLDAEDGIECRACHRIQGASQPTKVVKHRCLGCHKDSQSTLHSKVEDPQARECLSCHEFYEEAVDPWLCTDCHGEGSGQAATLDRSSLRSEAVARLRTRAPSRPVHEKDCGACHIPHGTNRVAPKTCLECHDDQRARHASGNPKGTVTIAEPQQCLECHGGHEPASAARRACVQCHDSYQSEALFKGHDRCVDCHVPHQSRDKKACATCHSDQPVLGADEIREHGQCESCHTPHRVLSGTVDTCQGCHDSSTKAAMSHPGDEDLGLCANCHPQHAVGKELVPALQCTKCHEEPKTDQGFHEGTDCGRCHEAHSFDLKLLGATLCRGCHTGEAAKHPDRGQATLVTPVEDHQDCVKCHLEGHHQPKSEKEACGTCHEDQQVGISEGHKSCSECHLPHEGSVSKNCIECHGEQSVSRHSLKLEECKDCHGSHQAKAREKDAKCVRCHDEPLPLMHGQEGHETCTDCHQFHDGEKRGDRASCLEGCHEDQAHHEPEAPKCLGCHPFESAPKEVWR